MGTAGAMPSPLDLVGLPLRLVDDVRRIAQTVATLPELTPVVKHIGDEVAGLRAELATLPTMISHLADSVDELGALVATLRADLQITRASVEPMDEDLRSVQAAVEGMAPRLVEVRDHIDMLREDLSSLPFVGKS